jgi:ribosomal protein L40E
MTIKEFDNHKTTHDISNSTQKSSNVQSWGVIGLWKNTSIRPCDAVPIPEGDDRLRLVATGPETNNYVVVKEVIREVLVSCRHCGARYPQGTVRCLTCGANL